MSDTPEIIEVALFAPLLFDQSIGYWTGEPDAEVLARALVTVDPVAEVEREVSASGVLLRGPVESTREQAYLLREAGLE